MDKNLSFLKKEKNLKIMHHIWFTTYSILCVVIPFIIIKNFNLTNLWIIILIILCNAIILSLFFLLLRFIFLLLILKNKKSALKFTIIWRSFTPSWGKFEEKKYMNKKELKKLIINKGGKIINNRIFKYNDTIYYFRYFIKDWEQPTSFLSIFKIKNDWRKLVYLFQDKGIIKINKKDKFGEGYLSYLAYLIMAPFVFSIFILSAFIFGPILFWVLSLSNKYQDLDKRIKELRKWSLACPENNCNRKKEKLNWAFRNFIANNYARKTKKKNIIRFEDYMNLKGKWYK